MIENQGKTAPKSLTGEKKYHVRGDIKYKKGGDI